MDADIKKGREATKGTGPGGKVEEGGKEIIVGNSKIKLKPIRSGVHIKPR